MVGCLAGSAARAQTDIARPFPVRSALDFPAPAYLFAGGRQTRGAQSGPVNTPRADGAFFTQPAFDKKGRSRRLFYHALTLTNPHDPFIPEERAWCIVWTPAADQNGSGGRAQRLFPQPGCDIQEIESDGKWLLVRQTPAFGSRRTDAPTARYRWAGDPLGHGRFVGEGRPEPAKRVLPPPNAFQRHRDRGYDLLGRSDAKAADAEFRAALTLRPKDAACWYARGAAAEAARSADGPAAIQRAIGAYGRAIALDPARIPAYRRRALLLTDVGRYDLALADLAQIVKREPNDYGSWMLRAGVYARKGDFTRAAADARQAIQREPTESEPYALLALYQYRSGNFPEAIASAETALKRDESENRARLVLAYIYARRNQTDRAIQEMRDARENGISAGERREGIMEVRRVLKSQPNSAALKTLQEILRGEEGLEPGAQRSVWPRTDKTAACML
jgi:tetratricopeptide (TPR) repeat protein